MSNLKGSRFVPTAVVFSGDGDVALPGVCGEEAEPFPNSTSGLSGMGGALGKRITLGFRNSTRGISHQNLGWLGTQSMCPFNYHGIAITRKVVLGDQRYSSRQLEINFVSVPTCLIPFVPTQPLLEV